jgi:hypothetical protein
MIDPKVPVSLNCNSLGTLYNKRMDGTKDPISGQVGAGLYAYQNSMMKYRAVQQVPS